MWRRGGARSARRPPSRPAAAARRALRTRGSAPPPAGRKRTLRAPRLTWRSGRRRRGPGRGASCQPRRGPTGRAPRVMQAAMPGPRRGRRPWRNRREHTSTPSSPPARPRKPPPAMPRPPPPRPAWAPPRARPGRAAPGQRPRRRRPPARPRAQRAWMSRWQKAGNTRGWGDPGMASHRSAPATAARQAPAWPAPCCPCRAESMPRAPGRRRCQRTRSARGSPRGWSGRKHRRAAAGAAEARGPGAPSCAARANPRHNPPPRVGPRPRAAPRHRGRLRPWGAAWPARRRAPSAPPPHTSR
mmetsp:Transcript_46236/g.143063  ORF Transcript_46236/g.143063 Transcript_46236/m.143063 type:complete len:300 (-) Transcript_46236:3484-4383(-)